MTFSMKNQTALVTGAGSGIGQAIAKALAAEGARVCLTGRNAKKLTDTATLCGSGAVCRAADLADEASIQKLAEFVRETVGRLDILVHSAGAFHMCKIESTATLDFDRLFHVNVRAPFIITRELLPLLRESKGQIVFINSSAALHAAPYWGLYAASKSALKSLANSLRIEVNPDDVRIVSIFPGRTASPMQAQIHSLEGKPYNPDRLIQPADIAAMVISALRLPRTAEVTDVMVRPMLKG